MAMLSPSAAAPGRRRASNRFQSTRPQRDRERYEGLLTAAGGAGGGKRIVAAGGALVSSHATKQSAAAAAGLRRAEVPPWLRTKEVMVRAFEYLGIHHLFLGQVDDDDMRLFQSPRPPNVPSTRLVCKGWAQFAKDLERVDLRPLRYTVTDEYLQKALKLFRSCKVLFLSECRRLKFMVASFTSAMKNLEVLNLVGCSNLTDASLSVITMECPKLRELYIPACPKLEKVPIHKPPEGSCVEVLDLSANGKVADEVVTRLCRDLPRLRELFLSQLERLEAPEVKSETLELLNIDGCELMTFKNAVGMMRNCPNLKFATLGDNDLMLSEKQKQFPRFACMLELNIAGTFHNDETVNSVLQGMPNLRMLDCGNSEFLKAPSLVHPELEFFVANMCCDLQDSSLAMAAKGMPKLRHLACNHCDALVRPAIASESLDLVDLSNCINLLSDRKVLRWLQCPKLSTLFVGHNAGLTDPELETLVAGVPQLADLNCYQATNLHAPTLAGMVNLETINITNCWNLDPQWVDELDLPRLETIFMNLDEGGAVEEVEEGEPDEGGDAGGW